MADTLEAEFASTSGNSEQNLTIAGAFDVTVLSFTICNNADSPTATIDVYIKDNSDSSNAKYLYKDITLPGRTTFEHVDKIVLDDNDTLCWIMTAPTSSQPQVESYCSYLKQTA